MTTLKKYHSDDNFREHRKAQMRAYYYANKNKWKEYQNRELIIRLGRKNKGVAKFFALRAKCIWYLVKVRKWSYGKTAKRLSTNANAVRQVLKRMENRNAKEAIPGWRPEVTATKDFNMIELWDDRAIQVIPNTGLSLAEATLAEELAKQGTP